MSALLLHVAGKVVIGFIAASLYRKPLLAMILAGFVTYILGI